MKIRALFVWAFFAIYLLLSLATLSVLGVIDARAAEVGLIWDAVAPPIDGYKLFQREDGQKYDFTAPVWTGTETKALIQNLTPLTQYYFVVRAYSMEDESGDSNEVGARPPIPAPNNLRINVEISVLIDINGQPYVKAEKTGAP